MIAALGHFRPALHRLPLDAEWKALHSNPLIQMSGISVQFPFVIVETSVCQHKVMRRLLRVARLGDEEVELSTIDR